MFCVVKIVLVLVFLHLGVSQDGLPYHIIAPGISAPGGGSGALRGGTGDGLSFVGVQRPPGVQAGGQFQQPGQIGGASSGSFAGVTSGSVGQVGFGTFPDFGQANAVVSLPSRQGAFIGGQGGSFVGGSTFGQGGASIPALQQGGFPPTPALGSFQSSVVQQQLTPTVTRTTTVDVFTTLTDLVLHSVPVTRTQFALQTTTARTRVVVPTPVDDVYALSTSVVASPTYLTLTETKSDFRVAVRTSTQYVTLTHTTYAITHVPVTIIVRETVRVSSAVVRTIVNTSVETVTRYRTVAHTEYVHDGYY